MFFVEHVLKLVFHFSSQFFIFFFFIPLSIFVTFLVLSFFIHFSSPGLQWSTSHPLDESTNFAKRINLWRHILTLLSVCKTVLFSVIIRGRTSGEGGGAGRGVRRAWVGGEMGSVYYGDKVWCLTKCPNWATCRNVSYIEKTDRNTSTSLI